MAGSRQCCLEPATFLDYPLKIYGIWSIMEVKYIKAFLYNTSVSIFINQGAQNVQFHGAQNVKFPKSSFFTRFPYSWNWTGRDIYTNDFLEQLYIPYSRYRKDFEYLKYFGDYLRLFRRVYRINFAEFTRLLDREISQNHDFCSNTGIVSKLLMNFWNNLHMWKGQFLRIRERELGGFSSVYLNY